VFAPDTLTLHPHFLDYDIWIIKESRTLHRCTPRVLFLMVGPQNPPYQAVKTDKAGLIHNHSVLESIGNFVGDAVPAILTSFFYNVCMIVWIVTHTVQIFLSFLKQYPQ
jgi:hypothetical protein